MRTTGFRVGDLTGPARWRFALGALVAAALVALPVLAGFFD